MKWLALVLLIANAAIWFAGDWWVPERTRMVAVEQTLPRVTSLKVDPSIATDDGPSEAVAERAGQEPEPEPVAEVRTCVRLGWFETAEAAHDAYSAIGRPGEFVEVAEQERSLEPLHWIIIPPQPEDRALRLFNDLRRRGIDSYLVTRGENRNAISLGLFQSREAAERVLEAKKRQNLNAVLANFPRNQISYALVFEVPQAEDADAGEGQEMDYRNDFEMAEISRCEGIATTPENP